MISFRRLLATSLLLAVSLVFSASLSAMNDREFEKLMFTEGIKEAKIHGFQGCINKEKCGSYGFYLQTYSPEGLCNKCELKQYPERYVACPCCRAPMERCTELNGKKELSFVCLDCHSKIQGILVDLLKMNDDRRHNQALAIGAFRCLNNARYAISRKFIASLSRLEFGGVGIYRGAVRLKNGNLRHVWSKHISIDPSDKKPVATFKDAKELVRSIVLKYNIFGVETGTEILEKDIPEDAIYYEEVVG